jgi:hypothetical protein
MARFRHQFHRQPGGRTPEAENLDNLPPGYYERLIIGFAGNDNKIRRFVDNEFGAVNNGQPVYPEFNDALPRRQGVRAADPRPCRSTSASTAARPRRRCSARRTRLGQVRVLAECVVFNPTPRSSSPRWGRASSARKCREYFDRMWPNAKVGEIGATRRASTAAATAASAEDLAWMQEFGRASARRSAPRRGPRATASRAARSGAQAA